VVTASAGEGEVMSAETDTLTEDEWLTSSDAWRLSRLRPHQPSERQYALITAACLRQFWRPDRRRRPRVTVADVERLTDGLPSGFDPVKDREFFTIGAMGPVGRGFISVGFGLLEPDYSFYLYAKCPEGAVAAILRDVMGNPYRPAPLIGCGGRLAALTRLTPAQAKQQSRGNLRGFPDSGPIYDTDPPAMWFAWNGGALRQLAQAFYDEHRFNELPVLADAFEEAGCTTPEILHHCRQPGPHVRGCWVVDALLGKS
jgi:hypothetical protein